MTAFIIIGRGGSGKTTARKHLEMFKFKGFEASEYAKRLINAIQEPDINAILNRYGRDIVARKILSKMDDTSSVISGFRTSEEIECIKSSRSTKVIYLETDIATCFERVQKRDTGRYTSFNEFVEKKVRADEKLGLMKARTIADIIVNNSSTIADFFKNIKNACEVFE